ncbi:MAG: helix-turn-helix domain-containing protein [Thermoleophilia bacterium]
MFEIGSTLRDARVRRDISLQQAEDDTKIRVKYIQAMENEDFEILPAGTYVKGFLRTYAEYLDLDAQLLIDEYNERFGSGEHKEHVIQPTRSPKADTAPKAGRKHQTNYILVAILAVVIIAVLAYLGWGNSTSQKPTLVVTTETQASTQTTPTATAPVVTTTRTATTPTQTQPVVLQSVILAATSSENWVEIHKTSAEGEVIWGGTLAAGESKILEQKDLENQDSIWLTVGSPDGLTVSVNGQPQKLTEDVGEVYLITASGMTVQA